MRLTFAGTGCGATINPDRAGAGILLTNNTLPNDDSHLLLDCGSGVIERLIRSGLDHTAIQAVIFSHLHMDHAMGIAELLSQMAFRRRPMPDIYGPLGTAEYIDAAVHFARANRILRRDSAEDDLDSIDVQITRSGDEREVGGVQITTVEVPHVDYLECLARRFDCGGRSLVYSGDTRPAADVLVPLSDGADVLIHEAFTWDAVDEFTEHMPDGATDAIKDAFKSSHSDVDSVAQLAKEAGVKHLILTHLLPQETDDRLIARAAAHYQGEILAAHDGLTLAV
jgi:ribonuclease BN (tRNA processing enzyme)